MISSFLRLPLNRLQIFRDRSERNYFSLEVLKLAERRPMVIRISVSYNKLGIKEEFLPIPAKDVSIGSGKTKCLVNLDNAISHAHVNKLHSRG